HRPVGCDGLTAQSVWFAVANWLALWPIGPGGTREHARREEFRPVAEEIVIVALIVAGVTATLLLGRVGDPVASGSQRPR
ncbi:MAG: hypothetical protein L0K42_13125, partial [Acidipropionibacterium jensenii]|nr:hypothetical protein [Acidipropionibacterium jensenii]